MLLTKWSDIECFKNSCSTPVENHWIRGFKMTEEFQARGRMTGEAMREVGRGHIM